MVRAHEDIANVSAKTNTSVASGPLSGRHAQGQSSFGIRMRLNFMWAGIGRLLSIVFLFAMHVYLAHKLEAVEYGMYLWLESATMILSLIVLGGLPTIVLRMLRSELTLGHVEEASQIVVEAVFVLVGMSCLIPGVVLSVTSIPRLGFIDSAGLKPWLLWIIGWAVCTAVLRLLSEISRAYEMVGFSHLIGGQRGGFGVNGAMLCSVVACGTLAVVSLKAMLATQMAVQILSALFAAILVAWLATGQTPDVWIKCRFKKMFTMLCCSLPLLVQQLVVFGLPEADTLILASYGSAEEVAFYGAGRKLVLFATVPLLLINHAIMPFITDLYTARNLPQLRSLVRGAATIAALPGIVWTFILLIAPEYVLQTVFGSGFEQAGNALRVLCAGAAVFVATGSCGLVLVMTGHERSAMWSSLAIAILYLLVAPWLIKSYGVTGAAIGAAGLQVCSNVCSLLQVYFQVGIWTGVTLSKRDLAGFIALFRSSRITRAS